MQKNKFIMTLLATGLIGFGSTAHAFGLGLVAAGVASVFGWGETESLDAAEDASENGGGGIGMGSLVRGFVKEDAVARADQRLAKIKVELSPTAEQEPLWLDFVEKTRGEAEAGKLAREVRAKARQEQLAAPVYLERSYVALQEQLAARAATRDAFRRFYDVLTAEQRLVADRRMVGSGTKDGGEPPAAHVTGQPATNGPVAPTPQGGFGEG